jgi:tetratricopeptide (TPR) repeat protein
MPPHQVESWTEYWYPVQGLGGGFVEGTRDFALNVTYRQGEGSGKPAAEIAVNPTVAMQGAKIRVRLGSKPLRDFAAVPFEPLATKKFAVPVDDLAAAQKELEVTIFGPEGKTLLHWFAGDPIDGNPDFVAQAGVHPMRMKPDSEVGAEELFLRGVGDEKEGRPLEAARVYEEVVRRDGNYIPVLLKLAQQAYLGADFPAAEGLIARAIACDATDSQARYLAGVIDKGTGRLSQAQDAFWEAIRFGAPQAPVLAQLGEVAIRQKDYAQAETLLRESLRFNPDDGLTLSALAVAVRLAGDGHRAGQIAAQAAEKMPILPYALAEQWRNAEALGAGSAAAIAAARLWRQVVGFRSQSYLEAGAWYRELGDLASSDWILQAASGDLRPNQVSPLVYYYLAANAWDEGKSAPGAQYARQAAQANPAAVFPARVTEAAVLRRALDHDPSDAHAQYFLGNFLFAHNQYQAAAELWSKAADAGLAYSVLYRNVGVFAWKVKHDLKQAMQDYQKAIDLAPQDFRLYVDLDELYALAGDTSAREKLLAGAPAEVQDKDTVRARKTLLYVQLKQCDNALEALRGHAFKPSEGGRLIRQLFVLANVEKGRQALALHQDAQAEQAFRDAMTYPENIGVGKPSNPHEGEALYWLGKALQAEGKTEEARAAWQEAVQGRQGGSDDSERWAGTGEFYYALALDHLGRSEEAGQILDRLAGRAAHAQARPSVYYLAGLVEDYRGRHEQAVVDFRRALELDPSLWEARLEMERESSRQ